MTDCVFAAFLSFDASTANLDIDSQRRLVSALWVSGIGGYSEYARANLRLE